MIGKHCGTPAWASFGRTAQRRSFVMAPGLLPAASGTRERRPCRNSSTLVGPVRTGCVWFRRGARMGPYERPCCRASGCPDPVPAGPAPARTGCCAIRPAAPRANRSYLRRRGIRCTIPEQADRVRHRKDKGSAGCAGGPSLARSLPDYGTSRCDCDWGTPAIFHDRGGCWPPAAMPSSR
jgi:hypothetical protein